MDEGEGVEEKERGMEVEKEREAEGEQTDFLQREIKDKSPNKGKWFKNRSMLI